MECPCNVLHFQIGQAAFRLFALRDNPRELQKRVYAPIWLQLWVPFYCLLNLYGDMEMVRAMSILAGQSGDGGPTIKQWQEVGEKAQLSLAYLGSLSFIVPTFAWGLLKGGEYAMSAAVSAMSSGSGAASTAASVGGQAGMGNFNVGNKGIGNDSFWQQNSNSSRLAQGDYQGNVKGALMVQSITDDSLVSMRTKQHTVENMNAVTGYNAYQSPLQMYANKSSAAGFKVGEEEATRHTSEWLTDGDSSKLGYAKQFQGAAVPYMQAMNVGKGEDPLINGSGRIAQATAFGGAVDTLGKEKFFESAKWDINRMASAKYWEGIAGLRGTEGERTGFQGNPDNVFDTKKQGAEDGWGKAKSVQALSEYLGVPTADINAALHGNGTLGNVRMMWDPNKQGGIQYQHADTGNSKKHDDSDVTDKQKRTFEGEDYGLGNVVGLSARSGDVEAFKRAIPKDWERNATSREKLNEDITTAIEKQIVADKTRSVANATSLDLSATAKSGTPGEPIIGSGVSMQATLSNRTQSTNMDTRRRNEIFEQVSTATREAASNPGFKDKESRDKYLFDRIQVIKNGYSDTGTLLSHGNNFYRQVTK